MRRRCRIDQSTACARLWCSAEQKPLPEAGGYGAIGCVRRAFANPLHRMPMFGAAILCPAALSLQSSGMNTTYLRTRQISLALLVTAVVEQRQAPGASDVCNPNSSRLLGLGHELIHNASRKGLSRHR